MAALQTGRFACINAEQVKRLLLGSYLLTVILKLPGLYVHFFETDNESIGVC